MTVWQEALVALCLVVGGAFALIGSYGLLKLPDPMTRLHGPTKATTLGVGGVLAASVLFQAFAQGRLSAHELLVALFLFLTAPVTAHFIAKMHLLGSVPKTDLPPTGTDADWAGQPQDTGD